jgi:hypothetical protein
MILVELYSKDDCHLCDVAMELLLNIQKSHPFELRRIKIREGDDYFEDYDQRVPVVFINKEFAFQYRVLEKEFIAKIGQAAKEELSKKSA